MHSYVDTLFHLRPRIAYAILPYIFSIFFVLTSLVGDAALHVVGTCTPLVDLLTRSIRHSDTFGELRVDLELY